MNKNIVRKFVTADNQVYKLGLIMNESSDLVKEVNPKGLPGIVYVNEQKTKWVSLGNLDYLTVIKEYYFTDGYKFVKFF